ncbi:MAG TPA: amidase [Stellaceae bacterium]|nr:amidase [Stellaceae bacterium]
MASIPDYLTLAEAAHLIERRELSPVELVRSRLDRIAALDDRLHSFLLTVPEAALAAARMAEAEISAGTYRGPLHGIPIGLKDIFDTAGVATTGNSRVLIDRVPTRDATSVARLSAAGAISLGKLTTHEFAFGGPSFDLPWPPARNPWNTDHFTAGSSSGTAAAVAAGLILGGTGSDTGGSIRGPAALTGLAGLKPTYGLISRFGVLPLAQSLDHVGPMAWTTEDCALLLQALAGHDPEDPASVSVPIPDYRAGLTGDLRGLRIGVIRHFFEADNKVSPDSLTAIDAALDVFRGLGASLGEVTLSPLNDYAACGYIIMIAEAYAVHEANLKTRFTDFGEIFRDRMVQAAALSAADYIQAMRRRRQLIAEYTAATTGFDLVITAAAPGPAPRIDQVPKFAPADRPSFTMPFNITGLPALTVCCGFGDGDLPLGLQIVGRPFDEATVLRAGDAYEKATAWRARRPVLAAG